MFAQTIEMERRMPWGAPLPGDEPEMRLVCKCPRCGSNIYEGDTVYYGKRNSRYEERPIVGCWDCLTEMEAYCD